MQVTGIALIHICSKALTRILALGVQIVGDRHSQVSRMAQPYSEPELQESSGDIIVDQVPQIGSTDQET